MSFISNVPVPDVVKSSFGLAFIAYPTAVATLPGAPFWACLFFLMLFTLGLDSQFTILETVATAITDFSVFFRLRRTLLMGLCSLVLFLLGLLCCTRTGLNWVDVIDSYVGGWAIVFSSLLEMIALGSIYGGGFWSWFKGDRKREWLIEDIEMMIGKKSNFFWFYWRLTWYLVSPIVLTAIMVWSWVIYKPMNVPTWANAIGWVIVVLGLLFIPFYMLYYSCTATELPLWKIFMPNDEWGPYLSEYHVGRYAHKKNGEKSKVKGIENKIAPETSTSST